MRRPHIAIAMAWTLIGCAHPTEPIAATDKPTFSRTLESKTQLNEDVAWLRKERQYQAEAAPILKKEAEELKRKPDEELIGMNHMPEK